MKKENGNYYSHGLYRGYIGKMEKNVETTLEGLGSRFFLIWDLGF